MKFNKEKIMHPKTVIHCPEFWMMIELFKWVDSEKLEWWNAESFVNNSCGYSYKKDTCYDICDGLHGSIDCFKRKGYSILSFKEARENKMAELCKLKEQQKEMLKGIEKIGEEIKKMENKKTLELVPKDIGFAIEDTTNHIALTFGKLQALLFGESAYIVCEYTSPKKNDPTFYIEECKSLDLKAGDWVCIGDKKNKSDYHLITEDRTTLDSIYMAGSGIYRSYEVYPNVQKVVLT